MKDKYLELAPMEGITTYIYRNALNKYYGGIDKYFSPFISAHKNKVLSNKEIKDILPENNKGIELIPQVLSSNIEDFVNTTNQIKELGYSHINLNFGCPSGTVTAKGKGAGFLVYPEKLDSFLFDVFEKTDLKISVKTRLGYAEYDEWDRLKKIYMKYPLQELIIHARIREDFYTGKPRRDIVRESLEEIKDKFSVIYNGDIYSEKDYLSLNEDIPEINGCMIGRGIITDPSLAQKIKSNRNDFSKSVLKEFNLELMNSYYKEMQEDKNALFKLKELWVYMSQNIPDSKKFLKKIQKCSSLREYEMIIKSL